MYLWDYWTHPVSKNKYLFWYVTTPSLFLRDKMHVSGGYLLVVNDFADRDFFFCTGRDKGRFLLHVTAHFVKRYRERFLCDNNAYTEDVLVKYFHRNGGFDVELDPNEVNYHGERDSLTYSSLVPDGVVYFQMGKDTSTADSGVIVMRYKTFVSKDLLNERQEKHIQVVARAHLVEKLLNNAKGNHKTKMNR